MDLFYLHIILFLFKQLLINRTFDQYNILFPSTEETIKIKLNLTLLLNNTIEDRTIINSSIIF